VTWRRCKPFATICTYLRTRLLDFTGATNSASTQPLGNKTRCSPPQFLPEILIREPLDGSESIRTGSESARYHAISEAIPPRQREMLPAAGRSTLADYRTHLARPCFGHLSEMPTMRQLDCFRVADVQRTITRPCDVIVGVKRFGTA
jgi:hypothetical protein